MTDATLIGTRGSALALAQAHEVRDRLKKAHARLRFEIKIIKTTGDKMKTASLPRSGTKGLFTKELEAGLLQQKINIAVHSLKDLPTDVPAGLSIAAVPEREDPRDVLIFKDAGWSPERGGVIATSSPRRRLQLKRQWPKVDVIEIRGNVETRLKKLLESESWDAVVLAGAGLKRLGYLHASEPQCLLFEPGPSKTAVEVRKILDMDKPSGSVAKPAKGWPLRFRWLETSEMLPAPGQAALGIETLTSDERTKSLVEPINRFRSQAEVFAERAFLSAMGGGCLQPLAALAKSVNEQLTLTGLVFSADGTRHWEDQVAGPTRDYEQLGRALADTLKSKGAKF